MDQDKANIKQNQLHVEVSVSILAISTITVSVNTTTTNTTNTTTTSVSPPLLYHGKRVRICGLDSPEQFYWKVAQPALAVLNEETHGFFGILMDKLDESISESDLDEEEEEKLEKQWVSVMETIQFSLESGFDRTTKSWALVVVIADTPPLPWEISIKNKLIQEFVCELEYHYLMFGAVVKAGVKEIVGTLQRQVVQVIKQLEKHVAKLTKDGEDVDELKLFHKMEESFEQMDTSDFISKLMRRIVQKSIGDRIPKMSQKQRPPVKVFFSDMMQETAIVFEAYRRKGHIFDKFWSEMSQIMVKESTPRDLSSFLHRLNSNNELFVENVFAILVSGIPNYK